MLEELKSETRTIVLYEAPHRLVRTLEELLETLGNRRISVCRELTKKHETIFRTDFEKALSHYREQEPRGECVIVVEGKAAEEILKEKQEAWKEMTPREHVEMYESQGNSRKEAMRLAARDRGSAAQRDLSGSAHRRGEGVKKNPAPQDSHFCQTMSCIYSIKNR